MKELQKTTEAIVRNHRKTSMSTKAANVHTNMIDAEMLPPCAHRYKQHEGLERLDCVDTSRRSESDWYKDVKGEFKL